jgi:hypothetical protein
MRVFAREDAEYGGIENGGLPVKSPFASDESTGILSSAADG